jgi:hypothetical protein
MHSGAPNGLKPRPASLLLALASALILAAAFFWFMPYLTDRRNALSEIPAPPAHRAIVNFRVPPSRQACMSSIGMTPTSRVAQFQLRPAAGAARAGPPIELILSGSGYEARARTPGGYTQPDTVHLDVAAPRHALIAEACFLNRGVTPALLNGTTESRTVSRSATRIDGIPVAGDIALAFLDHPKRALVDRLGEIFGHASRLTDGLVPVWLIWFLAVLVAFGVPIATMAAFYVALQEGGFGSASGAAP